MRRCQKVVFFDLILKLLTCVYQQDLASLCGIFRVSLLSSALQRLSHAIQLGYKLWKTSDRAVKNQSMDKMGLSSDCQCLNFYFPFASKPTICSDIWETFCRLLVRLRVLKETAEFHSFQLSVLGNLERMGCITWGSGPFPDVWGPFHRQMGTGAS